MRGNHFFYTINFYQ